MPTLIALAMAEPYLNAGGLNISLVIAATCGAIRIIPKQSRVEFSADFKMTSDARSKLERILNVEIKI